MEGPSGRESLIQAGAVALFLLALTTRSGLLWAVSLLLGVAMGFIRLWGRYALERLEYKRSFSPGRCFAGEEVDLTIEVINRKILPVTYLAIDDLVPEELQIASRKLRFIRIGKGALRLFFGLSWYQKAVRRYRVKATRRGFYQLGPASLFGGDPFGYLVRTRTIQEPETLIVYPPLVSLEQVGIPSRRPFGDLRSQDRIFEDPMLFAGVRDYRSGDSLGRVHWKASAATGRLQVRLLDPSSSSGLCVFLNTWSYEQPWMGTDVNAFEAGCMLAASVVNWAVEAGVPVGLYANGLVRQWGMNLRLETARGPQVLTLALEGLARLETISNSPLSELMADEISRLSYGTSVVVIARQLPDDLAGAVLDVQRSGRPVTLVLTGSEAPTLPRLPGVRVYRVPGEEALHASVLA